jgi:hypothetical protein
MRACEEDRVLPVVVLVTPPWESATVTSSLLLELFDFNCAIIMSDDEARYNVSLLSHSNRLMLISFFF